MINMIISPFINAGCGADIHVIVKIESADSIPNLHSIITASDGVITLSCTISLWLLPK
jgi:pyruvate kinase